MPDRDPLQKDLDERLMGRDFAEVCRFFDRAGVNLQGEILERLMYDPNNSQGFVLLDVGSGLGNTIEHAIRATRLFVNAMHIYRKIDGVGVDRNLITDISSRIRELGKDIGCGPLPLAQFLEGDAVDLPLESNSIDVLFSSNTLIYVADTLKALEEGYRVLKPGGVAIWDVPFDNISCGPKFHGVLEITPGGKYVFRYCPIDDKKGVVVCKKSQSDGFEGFPFQVMRELRYVPDDGFETEVPARVGHFRSAIYRAMK